MQWTHKWQSQHALAQTSASVKASSLAQARPPSPAVEPWVSSLTDLVLSVTWRRVTPALRCIRGGDREDAATKPVDPGEPSPPAPPPLPAPPLHFRSQALSRRGGPGRPGSGAGIFSHFSEGSAQRRLAEFFSCQDERIVVTGSGTREGGEPLPLHRLS